MFAYQFQSIACALFVSTIMRAAVRLAGDELADVLLAQMYGGWKGPANGGPAWKVREEASVE